MTLLATLIIVLLSTSTPSVDATIETVSVPGIERALRIDDRLVVGASPSVASYRSLHELGIRVVVSVDGKPPDLEVIRAAGLRSIHLPIDYSGIEPDRLRSLARLAATETEPVYVHCHHGRHRAPAAAAILWMLRTSGSPDAALGILEKAGTARAYSGLWSAVRTHRAPDGSCLDAPLPERVEVAGIIASMIEIDRLREALEIEPVTGHAGGDDSAILVLEQLRELDRLDPTGRVGDRWWVMDLDASIRAAEALVAHVPDPGRPDLRRTLLDRLDATCTACHARHRR